MPQIKAANHHPMFQTGRIYPNYRVRKYNSKWIVIRSMNSSENNAWLTRKLEWASSDHAYYFQSYREAIQALKKSVGNVKWFKYE